MTPIVRLAGFQKCEQPVRDYRCLYLLQLLGWHLGKVSESDILASGRRKGDTREASAKQSYLRIGYILPHLPFPTSRWCFLSILASTCDLGCHIRV